MSDDRRRKGLAHRQKAWLDAYLGEARFNATEAARIAGYRDPVQAGYENKRRPEIAAVIARRLDASAMSADEVLARLADQARGIGEYLVYEEHDGGLGTYRVMRVDFERLKKDGLLHLVTGFETDKGGRLVVKFTDPQAALATLARHHKLLTDRVEHIDPDLDRQIEAELAKLARTGQGEVLEGSSGAQPDQPGE